MKRAHYKLMWIDGGLHVTTKGYLQIVTGFMCTRQTLIHNFGACE